MNPTNQNNKWINNKFVSWGTVQREDKKKSVIIMLPGRFVPNISEYNIWKGTKKEKKLGLPEVFQKMGH